jgi:hypothetical protein
MGILILAMLLQGCGSDQIRGPKPRSDWSRGLRIGHAMGFSSPCLIVHDDGTAHAAWTEKTLQNSGILGYAQLSPQGELVISASINIQEKHLRGANLRDTDPMELCWNSDDGVRCSILDFDDPTNINPYTLIPPSPSTSKYVTTGEYIAWITVENDLFLQGPDIPTTQLSSDALNLSLNPQGEHIYVVWTEEKTSAETTILLSTLTQDGLSEPHQLGRLIAAGTEGMRQIGLGAIDADGEACIFYGVEFTRGLQGGTAFTEYSCYNNRTWEPVGGERLGLVVTDKKTYIPLESGFALDRLAVAEDPVSDYTYLPSMPLSDGMGNIALLASTPETVRYKVYQQVVLMILQDGKLIGYQPISGSTGISISPSLGSDALGNLYAVWLERTTSTNVYIATTSPTAAARLDRMDLSDFSVTALGLIIESIAGLIMVPFALIFFAVGLAGFGAGALLTRWIQTQRLREVISLTLGIAFMWLAKLALIPQIQTYLPFSAWMPELSPGLAIVWQIFWPVLIVGLGLLVMRHFSRRFEHESLIIRFGLYGITDIFLTALCYGAILQGAG